MSSTGTDLEIIERHSGPATPPKTPMALPLKREHTLCYSNISVYKYTVILSPEGGKWGTGTSGDFTYPLL
jgi:hypothetical protein